VRANVAQLCTGRRGVERCKQPHRPPLRLMHCCRFGEYPQEIGIAFVDGAVNVSQIQLLSHQSKIATRIELFVGTGNDYYEAQFTRLGYLSLDSNERSQYKVRRSAALAGCSCAQAGLSVLRDPDTGYTIVAARALLWRACRWCVLTRAAVVCRTTSALSRSVTPRVSWRRTCAPVPRARAWRSHPQRFGATGCAAPLSASLYVRDCERTVCRPAS